MRKANLLRRKQIRNQLRRAEPVNPHLVEENDEGLPEIEELIG
jgi:hypothetical protein